VISDWYGAAAGRAEENPKRQKYLDAFNALRVKTFFFSQLDR
jgi:hypothetical protein